MLENLRFDSRDRSSRYENKICFHVRRLTVSIIEGFSEMYKILFSYFGSILNHEEFDMTRYTREIMEYIIINIYKENVHCDFNYKLINWLVIWMQLHKILQIYVWPCLNL